MKFRTSTFRTGFAAPIAAAALLASLVVSPALADSAEKRWKFGNGHDARPGTVGQVGREVNHGGDRGRHAGGRNDGPPWLGRPGHRGRDYAPPRHVAPPRYVAPPHFADRRRHRDDHYRYAPPPRYYGGPYRHRPYRRTFRYYYYQNTYIAPGPIYVIPYHVFDTRQVPVGRPPIVAGADTYCSGGAAPAYAGGSHQAGGTVVGGVVGALVGSQLGKGNGRLAAVGVGTLIGAMIGNDIGRSMDAVDSGYATGAVNRALETAPTCTTITWDNPQTGNYGAITPTRTFEPSPGRYCREFQQQVVIGGTLQDAYGTACRQPDGSWQIVAEQP